LKIQENNSPIHTGQRVHVKEYIYYVEDVYQN